jgi:ketosteroid isomerase-like protein
VSATPADAPVVRALCQAAREGDVSTVLALFSQSLDVDVVLHKAGELPHGGAFKGRDQVLAAVAQAGEFVDVTRIEVERIGANGDCVVAFLHTRWRAEAFAARGVPPPPDASMAQVWRFRHGRIVEIRPFSFDQPMIPFP